jgi:hypothetical protein
MLLCQACSTSGDVLMTSGPFRRSPNVHYRVCALGLDPLGPKCPVCQPDCVLKKSFNSVDLPCGCAARRGRFGSTAVTDELLYFPDYAFIRDRTSRVRFPVESLEILK